MYLFHGLLTCFMLGILVFDLSRYTIPNWMSGLLLALYPVMVLVTPEPVDWQSALLVMLAVFAVGFVIFSLRFMGGGDIKLMTVLALWTGTACSLEFLVYTGIGGGLLSVLLWLVRPMILSAYGRMGKEKPDLPRLFTIGQPVPYGVAIAASFLFLLWTGRVPGLPIY